MVRVGRVHEEAGTAAMRDEKAWLFHEAKIGSDRRIGNGLPGNSRFQETASAPCPNAGAIACASVAPD
jgi:hypothetical protein